MGKLEKILSILDRQGETEKAELIREAMELISSNDPLDHAIAIGKIQAATRGGVSNLRGDC